MGVGAALGIAMASIIAFTVFVVVIGYILKSFIFESEPINEGPAVELRLRKLHGVRTSRWWLPMS